MTPGDIFVVVWTILSGAFMAFVGYWLGFRQGYWLGYDDGRRISSVGDGKQTDVRPRQFRSQSDDNGRMPR